MPDIAPHERSFDSPLLTLSGAFYLLMASPALATIGFGALSGGPVHASDAFITIVPAMAAIGITLAFLLLQPVSRDLRNGGVRRASLSLSRLPARAAAASSAHTLLLIGGHQLLEHSHHDHIAGSVVVVYPLVLIATYALMMGLSIYFAASVIVVQFRGAAGTTGIDPSHSRRHLRHKVMLAIIGAVLPLVVATAHHRLVVAYPQLKTLSLDRLVSFDLLSSALLIVSALWFVHQALTRPVEALSTAMHAVESGRTDMRAAVLTNDELGTLAAGFNRMLDAVQEREVLRQTLGRFVPEGVADTALKGHGSVSPVSREATILFTDIVGFTALCETLSPLGVVSLLNEYFTAIAAPIRTQRGVVTQFQGDALIASFNLPVEDADHAHRAVVAALAIQSMLASRRFGPGLRLPTRIGISTGPVVGGTVGDSVHLGYTVHGDVVNLAQRLEQANKRTGTSVLISGRTAELIDGRVAIDALQPFRVPGRRADVQAFAVR